MATANNKQDIFTSKVIPIMNKVRDDLSRKQMEEYARHSTSVGAILSGAAGPDGGMSSMTAYNDQLYYIGEWNSKTVEDYINMVKAELKKQHITVDAVMEKKMIDYLVHQQMPKSTADYILRKAAEGSIFYIPQRARTSSLQDHINKKAEEKYNPSLLEEVAGNIGSWLINAATTWGAGGLFGQLAMDAGTEMVERTSQGQQKHYVEQQKQQAKNDVAAASKRKASIPKWMFDQMGFKNFAYATDKQLTMALDWANKNGQRYRNKVNQAVNAGERTVKANGKSTMISVSDATYRAMEYETFSKAIQKEISNRKNGKDAIHYSNIAEAEESNSYMPISNNEAVETDNTQSTSSNQPTGDYAGWDNLLGSMGLDGFGDTMQHLGITLSMLPDMLVGVFTGRTKSVGLNKETMMPLAALVSGTFVSNPLMKIPLMLYGGASLFNNVGQEALAEYKKENGNGKVSRYKHYADEELDKRLKNPQIEGNVLLVDMDNVPRLITLPPSVIEAYNDGALTINTIANRILAKADQSTISNRQGIQNISESYEEKQEREQVRGIR